MYCIEPALIDRRIGVRPRNVQGLHYRRIGLVRWRPAALAHIHDVHVMHMYNALLRTHMMCVHEIHMYNALRHTTTLAPLPGEFPAIHHYNCPSWGHPWSIVITTKIRGSLEELNFENIPFIKKLATNIYPSELC